MKKQWITFLSTMILSTVFQIGLTEKADELQIVSTYTQQGKVSQQVFYSEKGQPTVADDLGYCKKNYVWNSSQQLIAIQYLDAEDQLIDNNEGFAVMKQTYNKYGTPLECSWYDQDGSLTTGPDGYAREVNVADSNGKRIRDTRRYGIDGKLFKSDTVFARYEMVFNKEKGHPNDPLHEYFYDADGELMNGPDGWARAEYTYYSNTKKLLKQEYFDKEGRRVVDPKAGFAIMEQGFKNSRVDHISYYDDHEKLMIGPGGFASVYYTWTGFDQWKMLYYTSIISQCRLKLGTMGSSK